MSKSSTHDFANASSCGGVFQKTCHTPCAYMGNPWAWELVPAEKTCRGKRDLMVSTVIECVVDWLTRVNGVAQEVVVMMVRWWWC